MAKKPKVVVIGGGTGTSVVLTGLKALGKNDLTAIVAVSDSGGSTGRLRDEFGFLPVGDLRQCLAALAHGELEQEIRKVLLYRFAKGSGLKGHNLGNLILTALEDLYASPGKAIEVASQVFRINGQVYPITEKAVQLVTEYADGTVRIGEHLLDDPKLGGQKIIRVKISPHAQIYQQAAKSIKTADLIVLGPGDLYASLLPNTLVRGFKPALQSSKAKFVYVVNLMTHYSQTHEMTAQAHLDEVVKYCQRRPDIVIVNDNHIPKSILQAYAKQKEYPVIDDLVSTKDTEVIRGDFLSAVKVSQVKHDQVARSLLRHDGKKIARVISQLVKGK
ncbi:MAG: uridine diphosphate-N-acetylglucosamine-binding protein YvcK [Candidatus Pacebacteria bacterium]|nr:uridine diphosphate-N-acetylglucosamine-binding protein YvcK [Candidatus Paceibacterota bacterium]